VTGGPLPSATAAACTADAVTKLLDTTRQDLRQKLAGKVAQNIPRFGFASPVPGVSCIRNPAAFFAAYNKAGDNFTLACLAQKNNVFTHVFELTFKSDAPCLARSTYADKATALLRATQCKTPGQPQLFVKQVQSELLRCERSLEQALVTARPGPVPGTVQPPPGFEGSPTAVSIDAAYYNQLLEWRPTIGNIIDEDRRVKVGRSTTHDTSDPGSDSGCANPFNCTRDAK
jgi:hypothetical protein